MIITEEPLDCLTNSPCQHFRKMYREQYGEYAYWCWGVKGYWCNSQERPQMNFPLRYQYNLQQVGEERREEDIVWISVLLYPFWNHWQLMVLAIWLALSSAIHWQITSFLFLNCIFFQWESNSSPKYPNKVINQGK